MKKIIIILMFLLMIGSVNANYWESMYQDDNQGTQLRDADISVSSYQQIDVSISQADKYASQTQPVIGNFYPQLNKSFPDIVTHGSCGLRMITSVDYSQISYTDDFCNYGYTIDGMAVVDDLNGDGFHELMVVGSSLYGSTGYIIIYRFDSNGSFQIFRTHSTPYKHTGKFPVCGQDYCFINDINHNLHRFNLSSLTWATTSYGAMAQDEVERVMLYDECNSGNLYDELVIVGDLDDDGAVDDIAMVEDGSLTIIHINYNVITGSNISTTATCGNPDNYGEKIIGITIAQGAPYNCGVYCCRKGGSIHLLNESLGEIVSTGAGVVQYDCADPPSLIEGSPSQVMFDVGKDTGAVSTDRILVNFIKTGTSEVRMYNTSNLAQIGASILGGTTGNYRSGKPNSMIKIDIDNNFNRQDDVVTNRGHIVHYDRNTDTLTSLGNFPFASNTSKYIIAYSDVNTFTDFWFVDEALGDFIVYTDATGNVTPPLPLPSIISWAYRARIEPNETVQINITLTDDKNASQVLTAFDCDVGGALDYVWGYRGLTPQFYCSYPANATYTMMLWASDDDNHPSLNRSETNNILVQPNAMPTIGWIWSYPNPQLTNGVVQWLTIFHDDGYNSDIRMAFDCDNDSILDYNWGTYNIGQETTFNCTYSTVGTKTGKVYITDIQHLTQNVTENATVVIVSDVTPNVTCVGFTAPSCVLDCFFKDDFNYNYSIKCNGWENIERAPTGNKLYLALLNASHELYQNFSITIKDTEYQTFSIELDFIQYDWDDVYFDVREEDTGNLLTRMYWDYEELRAVQQVSPTDELLCEIALGEEVHIEMVFNFTSEKVTFYCKGETDELSFYDSGISEFGYLEVSWASYSLVDMYIDNLEISYGSPYNISAPPVVNITEGASYLDTGNFCAINWTAHTFIEDECVIRGYSTKAEWLQVCLIRSCLNDGFTYIYYQAQANIIKTLVVIIAILLLAPLAIMLVRKVKK